MTDKAIEAARVAWLEHASDYERLDESIAAACRAYTSALLSEDGKAPDARLEGERLAQTHEWNRGEAHMTLTDEQLAEILAGCEVATPGPWCAQPKVPYVERDPGPYPGDSYGPVKIGECGNWCDKELMPFNLHRWMADARHIARLDPQTVAALVTELQERRAGEGR